LEIPKSPVEATGDDVEEKAEKEVECPRIPSGREDGASTEDGDFGKEDEDGETKGKVVLMLLLLPPKAERAVNGLDAKGKEWRE
jgi:hypothetical protein